MLVAAVEKLHGHINNWSSVAFRPGQSGPDRRWKNVDHPVPKRASAYQEQRTQSERFPWDKDEDEEEEEETFEKKKKVKPPSMAELTIPEPELKRLRSLGLQVQGRLKVGRLGVTPGIVEAIHDRWRSCEIAKVRCDAPLSMNMKKAHEDLEVSRYYHLIPPYIQE